MSPGKKKIYLAAVLLGILALAADRLLWQAPASADAAVGAGPAATPAMPDHDPGQEQSDAKPRPPLFPKNLTSVTNSPVTRNPFDWPEPLAQRRRKRLAGITDEPQLEVAVRRPGEPLTIEQFISAHRLRGVFVDGPAAAIIDDDLIEVGQKFDASELLRIEGDSAFFQCQDGVAELTISSSR